MRFHQSLLIGMSAAGSYGIAQEVGGPFTGPLFWLVFTVCMLIGYTIVITYKPKPEPRTVHDDFGYNNRERFERRVKAIKDISDHWYEGSKIRDANGKFVARKQNIVVPSDVFLKIWDIADYTLMDTYVPDDWY